jgi:UDP-N-acetylglucosamine--N-acetylmuramyl-(pentapeptide) pyrophosphoryl-undecaprenol N-acetylglucosamine transferase
MSKRVVFTGGGTGGHVYPGLAVADELRALGLTDIRWIGSSRGIERRICRRVGMPFIGIPSGKLRRYFSVQNGVDVLRILAGFVRAFLILARLRPAFLFSKGGYVSVPPLVAARLLRIPSFTHESDLMPGLATRINARFADRVLLPYRESARYLEPRIQARAIATGNPVRRSIAMGSAEQGRAVTGAPAALPVVLFLGGSLGSATINRVVQGAAAPLDGRCFVVHQRGRHPAPFEEGPGYYSREFFYTEMPDLLALADLVVARAGAGTIWELAATGSPAILIPLGTAGSRGDQIENARVYQEAGAAVVIPDDEASAERVSDLVVTLLEAPKRRDRMARAAAAFGAPDVARNIAIMIRSALKEG